MKLTEADLKIYQGRVRHPLGVEATTGGRSGGDGTGHRPSGADSRLQKPPASPYRSKWEESHAYMLVLEKRTGLIKDYGYETMTLKLAKGARYRPDFTVWHLDGSIELREIKGHHVNKRDSLTHLKWAAQLHPWYRFTLWHYSGQGMRWESEAV